MVQYKEQICNANGALQGAIRYIWCATCVSVYSLRRLARRRKRCRISVFYTVDLEAAWKGSQKGMQPRRDG